MFLLLQAEIFFGAAEARTAGTPPQRIPTLAHYVLGRRESVTTKKSEMTWQRSCFRSPGYLLQKMQEVAGGLAIFGAGYPTNKKMQVAAKMRYQMGSTGMYIGIQ